MLRTALSITREDVIERGRARGQVAEMTAISGAMLRRLAKVAPPLPRCHGLDSAGLVTAVFIFT
jgi:hypothetical protein